MTQEQLEREMLAQPVRSLQYMLRQLANDYAFLPVLAVDGIFGENTLEAVMLYQRELHPPVTGVVDRALWNDIRDRWQQQARRSNQRGLRAFPQEGVEVCPGMERNYMALPQTMFQALSRCFNGIVPDQPDGLHGPASEENVRWLQKAGGLEPTGVLDWQTWELLCRLYEVFVVTEPELGPVLPDGGRG